MNFYKIVLCLCATVCVFCHTVCASENYDGEVGKIYYVGNTEEKLVALTFDDGPHKFRTNEILDVLEKYNVKATFFTVGVMAENYPDIIKREVAAGHEIGNHTYSHLNMRKSSPSVLKSELEKTEEILFEICEYRPKLFRPPEGLCFESIRRAAEEHDYNIILWDIDTLDWAHNELSSIISNVEEKVKPGSIILFHDYVSGNSPTVKAIDQIIPSLSERGYRFVTVSELISSDRSQTEAYGEVK